MCSVVPPLTGVFEEVSSTYFGVPPLTVTGALRTGLEIAYDNPRDVGADRIADAVAAKSLYGFPTIIVDFGTATVFDVISAEGVYLGGAIAPGISVAAEALFLNTSQLRRIELIPPASAIGRTPPRRSRPGWCWATPSWSRAWLPASRRAGRRRHRGRHRRPGQRDLSGNRYFRPHQS